MKPTNFGKLLRKLRIDHNQILLDMAKKLEVTASYLSAVENGKRNVPEDWLMKIRELYSLTEDEEKQLRNAADEQIKIVKINTVDCDSARKNTVLAFARRINELSEDELESLRKILNREDHR